MSANTTPLIGDQSYTDLETPQYGLGAFYHDHVHSQHYDWKDHVKTLPIEHAYAQNLPPMNSTTPFDINIYEIQAVLRAVELWGHIWEHKKLVVNTDNKTMQLGVKQTPRNAAHGQSMNGDGSEFEMIKEVPDIYLLATTISLVCST